MTQKNRKTVYPCRKCGTPYKKKIITCEKCGISGCESCTANRICIDCRTDYTGRRYDRNINPIKYISMILMIMMMSSFAFADISDGLLHYYTFDGDTDDSVGSEDWTNSGSTLTTGYIDQGYDFESTESDYMVIDDPTPTDAFSISLWFKPESYGDSNAKVFYARDDIDGYPFVTFGFAGEDINDGSISLRDDDTNYESTPSTGMSGGNWYHMVLVVNATSQGFYINGTALDSNTLTTLTSYSNYDYYKLCGANEDGLSNNCDGIIDEVGIWDRAISADEVTYLFEGNRPLSSPESQVSPVFYPPTPANNTISDDSQVSINVSCDDNVSLVSLFFDNVSPPSVLIDGYNNTIPFLWDTNVSSDRWFYSASCDGGITTGDEYVWILNDTIDPTITFNVPSSDNTSSFTNTSAVNLNISITDDNLFFYQALFYAPNGTLFLNVSESEIQDGDASVTNSVTFPYVGTWTLDVTATDDHTINLIDDYKYKQSGGKITFIDEKIDTQDYLKEDNVTIEDKSGYGSVSTSIKKQVDRYIFSYAYDINDNLLKSAFIRYKYDVKCSGISYRKDSKYNAHFVCPSSGNWIDFEDDSILSTEVFRCGEDCYTVIIDRIPSENVSYRSIGSVNVVTLSSMFEVTDGEASSSQLSGFRNLLTIAECPDDTLQDTILFIFIGIVIVVLYIIAETKVRIGIINIFVWVAGLFYSFTLMGCSEVIGFILLIMCIGGMMYEMTR